MILVALPLPDWMRIPQSDLQPTPRPFLEKGLISTDLENTFPPVNAADKSACWKYIRQFAKHSFFKSGLANKLIIVTKNEKRFSKINQLKIEN